METCQARASRTQRDPQARPSRGTGKAPTARRVQTTQRACENSAEALVRSGSSRRTGAAMQVQCSCQPPGLHASRQSSAEPREPGRRAPLTAPLAHTPAAPSRLPRRGRVPAPNERGSNSIQLQKHPDEAGRVDRDEYTACARSGGSKRQRAVRLPTPGPPSAQRGVVTRPCPPSKATDRPSLDGGMATGGRLHREEGGDAP